MEYKIINNELFIARKEILKGYEKEILEILLKKKTDVSLVKISKELNIKPMYAKDIITNLQKKLSYNWEIKSNNTKSWIYYTIKPKKEG